MTSCTARGNRIQCALAMDTEFSRTTINGNRCGTLWSSHPMFFTLHTLSK